MSLFSSVRRQLILWLGGEVVERPAAPVRPAPGPAEQPSAVARPAQQFTDDSAFQPLVPAAHAAPAVAPAAEVPVAGEPYPNDRRTIARRASGACLRVLVVDDSPTIVALLRKLLQQNGFETLEALDAETGIQLAREARPHLIFLDIVLPGMDGFAALRNLRRDPLTKSIPIIMISGNAAATEQFYVQRIGADDFMKKPFGRGDVFGRIQQLVERGRLPAYAAPASELLVNDEAVALPDPIDMTNPEVTRQAATVTSYERFDTAD